MLPFPDDVSSGAAPDVSVEKSSQLDANPASNVPGEPSTTDAPTGTPDHHEDEPVVRAARSPPELAQDEEPEAEGIQPAARTHSPAAQSPPDGPSINQKETMMEFKTNSLEDSKYFL